MIKSNAVPIIAFIIVLACALLASVDIAANAAIDAGLKSGVANVLAQGADIVSQLGA